MNFKQIAVIGIVAIATILGAQENFEFKFAGENGMNGWNKTQKLEVATGEKGLTLINRGTDAKIFRAFKPEPGKYQLHVSGTNVRVEIRKDNWIAENLICKLLVKTPETAGAGTFEVKEKGNYHIICIAPIKEGTISTVKIVLDKQD